MIIKLPSKSPIETYNLGTAIGRQLSSSQVILLSGDLGAGKTLLTKGIVAGMGGDEHMVVSPSYTLMNEYRCGRNDEIRIFHYDLYRLGPSGAAGLPEIDDYIDEGVIIIEWAQFLQADYFRTENVIKITLELSKTNDDHRILVIDSAHLEFTLNCASHRHRSGVGKKK